MTHTTDFYHLLILTINTVKIVKKKTFTELNVYASHILKKYKLNATIYLAENNLKNITCPIKNKPLNSYLAIKVKKKCYG